MDKIARHRLLRLIGLLLLALALYLVTRYTLNLDRLIAHELWLRSELDARPLQGTVIALLAFTLVSLIPGLSGKSLVVGWLVGFWRGLLVVNCGLTIAAVIAFLVSRHLLRDLVRRKLHWFMRRLRYRLRRNDGTFLLTLRLLHAPYSVTNYALGATDVPLRSFWWTTQVGLLPGNVAFVAAGASLPSLERLREEGVWGMVNLPLLIGLTLVGFMPIVIRWAVRRNLQVPASS